MARVQSKKEMGEAKRKEILRHTYRCFTEAGEALAMYEICILDATEHLLWVAGFDTTIRLYRNNNRLVVGLFANRRPQRKHKGSITLADLFNAWLATNGPRRALWLSFESDVALSRKEVERVKEALSLKGKI